MNIDFVTSDLLPIYKNITQDYFLGIHLGYDSYEEAKKELEKELKIQANGNVNSYKYYIIYHHIPSNKYGFLVTDDIIELKSEHLTYLYNYYNENLIKQSITNFLEKHDKYKLFQLIDTIESENIIKDLLDEG